MHAKPEGFDNRLAYSINMLQKGERLARSLADDGYYLAFSGGKDSQALYHVAKLAGVRFSAHYSVTTIDPPELVRFIRRCYPDVAFERPELGFFALCIKKRMLPTMQVRFCCKELKEVAGYGHVTLTGVRREESWRRSRRCEIELQSRRKGAAYAGDLSQFDEFSIKRELEGVQCIGGRDKLVMNPILYWSFRDVWYFLREVVKVEYCTLYDQGSTRLGCMFCPMETRRGLLRATERYPKYYRLMLRTIARLREDGYMRNYPTLTDEEIFRWWASKQNIKEWYSMNKQQGKLF